MKHPYHEIQVTTNFSFLEGASHPEEMARTAAALGYASVSVTDRNTLAGVVRAHTAAKEAGVRFHVGARLHVSAGGDIVRVLAHPTDRASYGSLCALLTSANLSGDRRDVTVPEEELFSRARGLLLTYVPPYPYAVTGGGAAHAAFAAAVRAAREAAPEGLSIAVTKSYGNGDAARLARVTRLSRTLGVPLVATNDAYYHHPARRPLQDVLVCVRHGCTVREAGRRLFANAERHLKPPPEMYRLFADAPETLARGAEMSERASGFSLDQLVYEYPPEVCPEGEDASAYLRRSIGALPTVAKACPVA